MEKILKLVWFVFFMICGERLRAGELPPINGSKKYKGKETFDKNNKKVNRTDQNVDDDCDVLTQEVSTLFMQQRSGVNVHGLRIETSEEICPEVKECTWFPRAQDDKNSKRQGSFSPQKKYNHNILLKIDEMEEN